MAQSAKKRIAKKSIKNKGNQIKNQKIVQKNQEIFKKLSK
jgi:hypothetical protein